ncbi:DUF2303 family protein [Tsukamurella asaccharolytica]|uniref:DUF2303 family protein n=1 Tax=Tsukamurella asaccharolytica TaxID=2592067 RepID=A0A5C5RFB7_9ACTN|nr:DUF2303 family protein [Tsukamurella asaccharolytica]TWS20811.1 DUF2303 family protein [Tsukamurella asaccharolytica]
MSDSNIHLPQINTESITPEEYGVDGPVHVFIANGVEGLETKVVDVRAEVPDAFPPRTTVPRKVTDQASFLAEVKRRPLLDGLSTVWANRKTGTVSVIYDELGADATADYTRRQDFLTLQFVRDPDWTLLMNTISKEPCGQLEFSDLIESVGHLITSHPAAELMEIAESLRTSSQARFESRPNRANGSQVFTYAEEVSATAGRSAQLEVPTTITFRAAPFEDFPPVDVTCWFRFRVNGGNPRLTLEAQPFDHVIRATWSTVIDDLAENLGVPVYAANL